MRCAPLSNPESRAIHGFETRFRVVARNIGNYTGEPVIEVEEVVVATPSFSYEDYLETRVFHLLLTIFYYEGNFEEAFAFALQQGVKAFDLIVRMQEMPPQAPTKFQRLIADFLRESEEELFETKEACIEWARANFDALVDGSLGGNLLSKYSLRGRFHVFHEALDFLQSVILSSLDDSSDERRSAQLKTAIEYLRSVTLHAPFAASLKFERDARMGNLLRRGGVEPRWLRQEPRRLRFFRPANFQGVGFD